MNIVQKRKARSTELPVLVVDNRDKSYFDDDQKWYTVCEEHGGLVGHETRALAVSWSAEPEAWCPTCQALSEELHFGKTQLIQQEGE